MTRFQPGTSDSDSDSLVFLAPLSKNYFKGGPAGGRQWSPVVSRARQGARVQCLLFEFRLSGKSTGHAFVSICKPAFLQLPNGRMIDLLAAGFNLGPCKRS